MEREYIKELQKYKCLIPNCKKISLSRGLCSNCYAIAKRYIKAKRTTWEILEKANMALPSTQGETAFERVYKKNIIL